MKFRIADYRIRFLRSRTNCVQRTKTRREMIITGAMSNGGYCISPCTIADGMVRLARCMAAMRTQWGANDQRNRFSASEQPKRQELKSSKRFYQRHSVTMLSFNYQVHWVYVRVRCVLIFSFSSCSLCTSIAYTSYAHKRSRDFSTERWIAWAPRIRFVAFRVIRGCLHSFFIRNCNKLFLITIQI